MEPQQVIADYQKRAAQIGEQARAIQAEIAAIRGVDTSGDGAVTVTVNVQGGLEKLSFGASAADVALHDLGQMIVDTSRKARIRAARAAAQAVEPLVGANSPAMQQLRERIPGAAPDDSPDRPDLGGPDGPDSDPAAVAPAPPSATPSRLTRPVASAAPDDADGDADGDAAGYTRGG